jgi:Capsule assembly protein Wzi
VRSRSLCAAGVLCLLGTLQLRAQAPWSWREALSGKAPAVSSPQVPLDSWIYPAFARLAAWGYATEGYRDLRPWTRLNCVKMLAGMEEAFELYAAIPEAGAIYDALRKEFERDYLAAVEHPYAPYIRLNSVYESSIGIAGTPINDSFHFGQTLVNDYGRPYQEGANQIMGFNAQAGAGRFSFSVQGEYQLAPGRPAYPDSVRQAIAVMDDNPVAPPTPVPPSNQFRLIEANASVRLIGHEISIGKSSLWWGPGEGGAFAWSNNAEPIYMFRIKRVDPLWVPVLSKIVGPMQYDMFLGPLEGHTTPPGPWIQGQKVSFKPTANFEFGVSRTIVFAGEGHVPLTLGSFWNSFTSFDNVPLAVKFSRNDPGARYSSFDFTWRVPFLRNWLTLYTDSMAHDDPTPLSAPRRSAMRPGVYLSRFPGAPRLDFRAEAVYTDIPTSRSQGGKFFFFEDVYHDAYTNKGFILGDWIGREAKGGQAWLTYHSSPREEIQLSYRRAQAASDFVPGGTSQNDYSVRVIHRLTETVELNAFVQLEFWKAPILAAGRQTDLATGFQLTCFPQGR